jgi:flagellin-specific chaperone FliS
MKQLCEALEKKEARKVSEIIPLIRRLREAWGEADRQASRYKPGSIAVAA